MEATLVTKVNVDEIKRDLPTYLQRVQAGETFIIVKSGKPLAEIKPITPATGLRPFGLCAGEFIVPDEFDAPLPENIIREFEAR